MADAIDMDAHTAAQIARLVDMATDGVVLLAIVIAAVVGFRWVFVK